jgi:hypothetical protein
MVSTADMMRTEFLREILLDLLEVKFGSLDPVICARVEKAPNDELVTWTRRVAVVTSLDAVFAA